MPSVGWPEFPRRHTAWHVRCLPVGFGAAAAMFEGAGGILGDMLLKSVAPERAEGAAALGTIHIFPRPVSVFASHRTPLQVGMPNPGVI